MTLTGRYRPEAEVEGFEKRTFNASHHAPPLAVA